MGGQALHRVALHVQDALELLGLPLFRQGDGLLREHCGEGMQLGQRWLRMLPCLPPPPEPGSPVTGLGHQVLSSSSPLSVLQVSLQEPLDSDARFTLDLWWGV